MPNSGHVKAAPLLKQLRERSGLSMDAVAKAAGYRGASSYQRYEDGQTFRKPYLPLDLAEKLARILAGRGTPPITAGEVMALAGVEVAKQNARRMIQIVGYVGAGAEVFPFDDGALDEIECPWTELGPSTVAVRVRGNSMEPAYFEGDIIYYEETSSDFRHLTGKECVIKLADGRCFVKQLRRNSEGKFYLYSHNSEPIFGVDIEWAARVKLIQRAN